MKLIDELYEFYRDKLTGDDEDINILAFAVLEEFDKEDILSLINDMDEQQLFDLMGLYLIESLRGKFSQQNFTKELSLNSNDTDRTIH